MFRAAADHPHRVLLMRGERGVALHQLRIAEDGVQRRPDLMADADDVAALGDVGGLGDALRLLQLVVGPLMCLDLMGQHLGLAFGFLFGDLAALMCQDHQPGDDA